MNALLSILEICAYSGLWSLRFCRDSCSCRFQFEFVSFWFSHFPRSFGLTVKLDDCIVAVATAAGVGAIAVIRLSGNGALDLVDRCFRGRKHLAESDGYTLHHGYVTDAKGLVIDEVLVSVFRVPHSYTGEDSVEISCHGGQMTTSKIMESIVAAGARIADPGEFTKRAFLNGRIDLSQAEAVADLISARSSRAHELSIGQLQGQLGQTIRRIRDSLIETCSLLEVDLDFTEEGISVVSPDQVISKLGEARIAIESLVDTYKYGKVVRDGVRVSIAGPPNAGKSSLFNRLVGQDRAIVSHLPGTTRDYLEESVLLSGILFIVADTAGIRQTYDAVEAEGVSRSISLARSSDITILVLDGSKSTNREAVVALLNEIDCSTKIIAAYNKIDLLEDQVRPAEVFGSGNREVHEVFLSALDGTGFESLGNTMVNFSLGGWPLSDVGTKVVSQRHASALEKASQQLTVAISSQEANMTSEFVALDVRSALASLGEITGEVTSEDILNSIFQRFCVGK